MVDGRTTDDGRTDDGRRLRGYTISSPCEPNGSGELKSGNTIFQIITLSVAMETSGGIWPNFKLIKGFMHDLIACKYEKDQMKNSGENVMTSFSPL